MRRCVCSQWRHIHRVTRRVNTDGQPQQQHQLHRLPCEQHRDDGDDPEGEPAGVDHASVLGGTRAEQRGVPRVQPAQHEVPQSGERNGAAQHLDRRDADGQLDCCRQTDGEQDDGCIRQSQPDPVATFHCRRLSKVAEVRGVTTVRVTDLVARGAATGTKPVRAMLRASSTEVMPRPLEP